VPCLDRSELILQIFGQHARTPQAGSRSSSRRCKYEMPRLRRRWTHLERQRGGIGVRGGAGEKQIDVDRNLLRTRIATITKDLEKIERAQGARGRRRAPICSRSRSSATRTRASRAS
jgi:GTP-binding protein HflX